MIKELPSGENVFIYTNFIGIIFKKNSLSNSRIIKIFISKNCYRTEHDFSHIFLQLNDILNLKQFAVKIKDE